MKTNATPIVAILAIALLSRLYATQPASTSLPRVLSHTTVQTPRIASQRILRDGDDYRRFFSKLGN